MAPRRAAETLGIAQWMVELLCISECAILSLSQSGIPAPLGTRDMGRAPAARRWIEVFLTWCMRRVLCARAAAETNNLAGSGHGLHAAVAIGLRARPNPMGARHATEPLGSVRRESPPLAAASRGIWIGVPAGRRGRRGEKGGPAGGGRPSGPSATSKRSR